MICQMFILCGFSCVWFFDFVAPCCWIVQSTMRSVSLSLDKAMVATTKRFSH